MDDDMDDMKMGGGAPGSPEELNAKSQAGAMQAIGKAAPKAREPLDPTTLNTLAEVATQTAAKLAGDEAVVPPVAEVTAPVDQVPPDLFSLLVVFDAFTQQAMPDMKIDLDSGTASNAGLQELTGKIGELGGEAAMKKATAPRPAPPAAPKEAEKPPIDAKRLVKKKPGKDETVFTAPSTMGPTV